MRIVAGKLGGRQFKAPHGHRTHPMSDKMRGALFNMLGEIEGLRLLDAFAGSGALTFEALSRGAGSALLLEKDRNAQKSIIENIIELGLGGRAKLIRASGGGWLTTQTNDQVFDLLLLDPPYDDLQHQLLNDLVQLVKADGQVALSWPGGQTPPELVGCTHYKDKQYGDGSLHLYFRDECGSISR